MKPCGLVLNGAKVNGNAGGETWLTCTGASMIMASLTGMPNPGLGALTKM